MTVTPQHPVWALLARHPYCEDVLAWHGIDPADPAIQLSVEQLADLFCIDETRLIRDLQAAADATPVFDAELWDDSANQDAWDDELDELAG